MSSLTFYLRAVVALTLLVPLNLPGRTQAHAAWQQTATLDAVTAERAAVDAVAANTPQAADTWVQAIPVSSPPARADHQMAFDSQSGKVVLFGGYAFSSVLGDTWLWDGAEWTELQTATGPSPRRSHGMAYDSARGRVVLFGGSPVASSPAPYLLNDTWEFDGANWLQVHTATTPPARAYHSLIYDIDRQVTVLFGGNYGFGPLDDTWEYDGTDWAQVSTAHAPSARFAYGFAYAAAEHHAILFGGCTGTDGCGLGNFGDTWRYDGTDWTAVSSGLAPSARYYPLMADDSHAGRVVLFGGYDGSGLTDTWSYAAGSWQDLAPGGTPPGRWGGAVAYDSVHRAVVVFGGAASTFLNDTWLYRAPTPTFDFAGFFPPVDNLPVLNVVRAGRAVPVKFSLGGDQGLSILEPGYPASTAVACGSTAEDAIEQTVTASSSGLSYDAATDQYTYVWKTDTAWAGTCRTLVLKLTDGTYHRADFRFK